MFNFAKLIAVASTIGCIATPAPAQYAPYPNQPGYNYPAYPGQPYPQQYPQNYPGYGYNQGYTGNPVTDIIDQLLGNRYSVTDRQAVRACAHAATTQGQNQYGGYPQGYREGYGYNQENAPRTLHVTSITGVEHRSNVIRVRGTLGDGYSGYRDSYGYPSRGYGYQGGGYEAAGHLSFRCTVDYRGAVLDLRVGPNGAYRSY